LEEENRKLRGGKGTALPVKPSHPKQKEKKKRKQWGRAFVRRREEKPEERRAHAREQCPDCGRKLGGGLGAWAPGSDRGGLSEAGGRARVPGTLVRALPEALGAEGGAERVGGARETALRGERAGTGHPAAHPRSQASAHDPRVVVGDGGGVHQQRRECAPAGRGAGSGGAGTGARQGEAAECRRGVWG